MRYTTRQLGEIVFLLGEFTAGRTFGEIQMEIFDLTASGLPVLLTTSGCFEIPGTSAGGFSTYGWSSDNITTAAITDTQYLYQMRDTVPPPTLGRRHKGKFTVGGFPDIAALARYEDAVHISAAYGSPLTTVATQIGADTYTFTATTITRIGTGNWVTEGFKLGQRIQITGTVSNDGVSPPITGISSTVLTFAGGAFTLEAVGAGSHFVAKMYIFPAGTDASPVVNVRDARQIADELGFSTYHIHDGTTVEIDFPHPEWQFTGKDQGLDTVEFVAGADNSDSNFTKLTIAGTCYGRMVADNCIIDGTPTITGVEGVFTNCAFGGTIKLKSGGEIIGDRISSRSALSTVIDFGNVGGSFLAGSVQGVFTAVNMYTGTLLGMSIAGAIVSLHPLTCSGGSATLLGYGTFSYGSTANDGMTIIDEVIRGSRLDENVSNIIPFIA